MNEILEQSVLFTGMDLEKIDKIFSGVFYQVKEYESGDLIAYQDEKVEHLMIVLEGIVRGEMVDFSGKIIIIEEIGGSRLLAPAFIFGENNYFPVNIVPLTNVRILKVSKSEFIKMLQKDNVLLNNFMSIISDRAQFLSQKLKFLSFNSIKGKFAYYILSIYKNTNSINITLSQSQEKLADLFGVARPSLGRAIREMNDEGLIESRGKNIKIIDSAGLNKLLN